MVTCVAWLNLAISLWFKVENSATSKLCVWLRQGIIIISCKVAKIRHNLIIFDDGIYLKLLLFWGYHINKLL